MSQYRVIVKLKNGKSEKTIVEDIKSLNINGQLSNKSDMFLYVENLIVSKDQIESVTINEINKN